MITNIQEIKQEIENRVSDKSTLATLLEITFKGLQPDTAKRAMLEAMLRGFKFEDFLQKNVYAVPFSGSYSLITSIDYSRKVGMRSGVCGTSAPVYEEKDGKIISCTITVKRKMGDYIGDYSATAFFDEYNTKRNLWISKPRTMIAKVAEMHALRKACPEELSQAYIEEEYQQDLVKAEISKEDKEKILLENKNKLEACKNVEELKLVWNSLPAESKTALDSVKNELKQKYESA